MIRLLIAGTLILSLLLLPGCSWICRMCDGDASGTTVVTTPPPEIEHPAAPMSMHMRSVEWRVYNRERLEEKLRNMSDEDGIVLFALDTQNYISLAHNMSQLQRYIREANQIILFYRITLPEILEDYHQNDDPNNED